MAMWHHHIDLQQSARPQIGAFPNAEIKLSLLIQMFWWPLKHVNHKVLSAFAQTSNKRYILDENF